METITHTEIDKFQVSIVFDLLLENSFVDFFAIMWYNS